MISVVIPTYNEAENIAKLIAQIPKSVSEIIVVDDSSPDGTADIVAKLAAIYPIKLIVRGKKGGLTSAVIEGAKLANSETIAIMDADLSHPPHLLPLMAKAAKYADIVIASRYVKGGLFLGPIKRKIISKIATLAAKLILKVKVKDPMSGFFLIKKNILLQTNIKCSGYKLLLNILVANRNAKIVEIPYTFGQRFKGQSKMNLREIVNYIVTIFRLLHL
jgi:dolichol-phosphate mannosyltransferase